ncbi:MAG: RtcB family protein [Candidatus Glassbacteria bacterium]
MIEKVNIRETSPCTWEIEQTGDMRVPGRIYGDEGTIKSLLSDLEKKKEWNALVQIINVAMLPGIQGASLAMADVHPGYGFCIGGVGAFDVDEGVVSVAGVGFDVNCGVRTMATELTRESLRGKEEDLALSLFRIVPAGLGSTGDIRLNQKEIDEVLVKGARFCIERGYGFEEDLTYIEEGGCLGGADPACVSVEAKKRQFKQVGTLGSGNHYLEVQYVAEIYDHDAAEHFGLRLGQVLVSIHCGSRALGHQIGTDYLKVLEEASRKYSIPIREKELVCAPIKSEEGKRYIAATKAGANCAFANRQAIAHLTRTAFKEAIGTDPRSIRTFYEVAHNIAKEESHEIDGRKRLLLVHRKGSTRAFGPGQKDVPHMYRPSGQPVLVGGTMGTCSYILRGTEKGMSDAFGSAIHGAGRLLSRRQAKKQWRGEQLIKELAGQGIIVKAHSKPGAAEEAPGAYKDIIGVVDVMDKAGINKKVAMLRPLICVKG